MRGWSGTESSGTSAAAANGAGELDAAPDEATHDDEVADGDEVPDGDKVSDRDEVSDGGEGRVDFDELFRAEYPPLVRLLTVACADPEAAADLAQDAFVQLHPHWDEVAGYEDLARWLRRVAVTGRPTTAEIEPGGPRSWRGGATRPRRERPVTHCPIWTCGGPSQTCPHGSGRWSPSTTSRTCRWSR